MGKKIRAIGILAGLIGGAALLTALARAPYTPDQPVSFNHKIHAGDYQISCYYCHIYATRSTVAGVPSIQKCMGCHKITGMTLPNVQTLQGYWNRKEEIPWIKVYDLQDFVYFSHKRHLKVELDCQACHGTVQTMEKVQKVSSLTMGWCLNCHQQRNASIDCLICHK